MLKSLAHLDKDAAVGVLARACLSLDQRGNPSAEPVVANEMDIRSHLIAEARRKIGATEDDESGETVARLSDYLDTAADELTGPIDTEAALLRLAERGDLPPDMYEIFIDPQLLENLGKFSLLERDLITATIRLPDRQQHYGRGNDPKDQPLVSMFFRVFTNRFPARNFGLLVIAGRDGMMLTVRQAWRIYGHVIDTRAATSLVYMARLFAEKFGAEIEVNGESGKFFELKSIPINMNIKLVLTPWKKRTINIIEFSKVIPNTGMRASSMVIATDFDKYKKYISENWIGRDEINELKRNLPSSPPPLI